MKKVAAQQNHPASELDGLISKATKSSFGGTKKRFFNLIQLILQHAHGSTALTHSITLFARCVSEYLFLQNKSCSTSQYLSCINDIYFHIARWRPNNGRIGKELPTILDSCIELLKNPSLCTDNAWQSLNRDLQDYSSNLRQRTVALETRQVRALESQDKLNVARQNINISINQSAKDARIPIWLDVFIHQTLSADLAILHLINSHHPTILRWLELLADLKTIYGTCSEVKPNDKSKQAMYALGPKVLDNLSEELIESLPHNPKYQTTINRLADSVVNCIKFQAVEVRPYSKLKESLSSSSVKLVNSSRRELNIEAYVGRWFHLLLEPENVSAQKLYHLNPTTEMVYFSDYYGKNTLQLSVEELSIMIAAKKLVAIKEFNKVYKAQLCKFVHTEEQRINRHQQEQLSTVASNQNHSSRRESRERITKELSSLSNYAKTSCPSVNVDKGKSENEKEKIGNFISETANLQLGAWIRLTGSSTGFHKLALKMPCSNKYVFTDRLGRKSFEFKIDDLVNLYRQDQINIVSPGERFDSKLEEIVKKQRR